MDEGHSINAIAAPAPAGRPRKFLGVLVLDTRFPRLPGDIGNPASFEVPVLTRVMRHVRPEHVVQAAAVQRAANLFAPAVAAMRQLEREGAAAITTSCGFLVLMQQQLQAAATVPVMTSSLLLLPGLLERHAQVGVLTISAPNLGEDYLEAAGVPATRMDDVVIEGVDRDGPFARAFLGNESTLDVNACRRDLVVAALRLQSRAPQVTQLVLECTNMPPHAPAIERASGLKTWSLLQSPALMAPFRQGEGA